MTKNNIAPDEIRRMLGHVSASLTHDDWFRVAAAIKSALPDSTGFDLFDTWSQGSGEAYDSKAVKSTWSSIKADGGVGIGTLIAMAKENGYTSPQAGQALSKPDAAEAARLAQERAKNQQLEQERQAAAHARAALDAAAQWEQASETGESAYLTRKGVQAYGVRFSAGGGLFVPLRDGSGKLWNRQRIAPDKPANGGTDKLFLKGGRKTGLWHMLGDPVEQALILVAEGYATAASLHEATNYPVAVAFDAGNLIHVAKALQTLHSGSQLVICGDDDVQTSAQTGRNPGREKAGTAAKAVRGLVVFPEPLPGGGSDFNDLHQAAGLEAVRSCIATAIKAHQDSQSAAKADQPGGVESEPAPSKSANPFDAFFVNERGVWHRGVDRDGNPKSPMWICGPLEVVARTRDQDGGGWGYYLTFADPLGHAKQWAMPARMLAGDGGEYRSTLLNMGLQLNTTSAARNLLTQFIQTRKPEEIASCTDRIGWHGPAFVLPRETIGDDAERIVFQSDYAVENTFRSKGTAEQWRDRVGTLCAGNSRLVFAVACAFAGPVLRPAGMESGGFHYRGDSSSGKTTALKIAASVYGSTSFLQRWRATDNALEAIATQHSDCLLPLDELAQIDPKTAGECAYMLANEQGKARATRSGTPRTRQAWRLLFLSAGELGLADHMAEGMKRARTGQEVRMADIPVDAGANMGAFEDLHGHEGGAVFVKHITHQAQAVYGATGRAWLQWLCDHVDTLKARIRESSAALAQQLVPEAASGQVERVGARFALVGAAGELATAAGLTGWSKGESERAARACFNAWLEARGGTGNGEAVSMLRAVRRFLEAHGEGRFTWWHRAGDDHNAKTLQRAGFKRMLNADGEPIKTNSQHGAEFGERMPAALGEEVSLEYFILTEPFRAEVCQGFDYRAVCAVLIERGVLIPDKGRAFDTRQRLPALGLAWCYRISPKIFEIEI